MSSASNVLLRSLEFAALSYGLLVALGCMYAIGYAVMETVTFPLMQALDGAHPIIHYCFESRFFMAVFGAIPFALFMLPPLVYAFCRYGLSLAFLSPIAVYSFGIPFLMTGTFDVHNTELQDIVQAAIPSNFKIYAMNLAALLVVSAFLWIYVTFLRHHSHPNVDDNDDDDENATHDQQDQKKHD